MSPRAARLGLVAGAALSVPAWYLLNACALSSTVGMPKSWLPVVVAAIVAAGILAGMGAMAARNAGAQRLADGLAAGMTAGALAAVPLGLLVVPGVVAVSLGVNPLLAAAEATDAQALRSLAGPVVIQVLWAAPLFTLGLAAWLTVIGGMSGAAYQGFAAVLPRTPAAALARTTA